MMFVKSSEYTKAVLAIDCALGGCIAAVRPAGSDKIFSKTLMTEREQAAILVPMVQDVMKEAGVSMPDLGLIVTSIGPGSFTGLRIGLSTARSMGLALDIPVQGVSTLAAMMHSCAEPNNVREYLVVLETKRRDFYVAVYKGAREIILEPQCMEASAIAQMAMGKNYILCGDGVGRLQDEMGEAKALFDTVQERLMLEPSALLEYGLSEFTRNNCVTGKAEPVYLRGADVSMSNKTQREIREIP